MHPGLSQRDFENLMRIVDTLEKNIMGSFV